MIDVNRLRGMISEKGMSQRKVAKILGMTEKTFYTKMRKGVFDSDEMQCMVDVLQIENPSEIFFAK